MNRNVYGKTEKGREEIATRKDRLPGRLRALLLLIDGQRSVDDLARSFGSSAATADQVATLLGGQYIALVASAAASARGVPVRPQYVPGPEPAPLVKVSATPPVAVVAASMHDIYSSRRP